MNSEFPRWTSEARLYPEAQPLLFKVKNRIEKAQQVCQKRYENFLADNDLTPDFLAGFLDQPPLNEFSFRFPDFPDSSYTLWALSQGKSFCDLPFRNEDPNSPDPQVISLGFLYKDFLQLSSFSFKGSRHSQRYVSTSFFPERPVLMYEITEPNVLFPIPPNSPCAKLDQQAAIKFFYHPNGQSQRFELAFGFAENNSLLGVFEKDLKKVRHTEGFFFEDWKWRFGYKIKTGNVVISYLITIDPLLAIDNIANLRPAFEESVK
ncbi:hypothetical protein A2Z23_02545 [Candidatus Curtissbacteria bacterium RBG_16_39_7]|uniref:Uncharacterized protein n=1 Tax=Candidatus Curtissbacteria bacterium RBG_16_39_7 TaxID=1797707 RepID=A0A1F5G365_9BACT|nr:MAG: hypothetical protein A2Z23_02545 [Candidatus Curtissbacteria bacterium RBG_16_39_7]